MTLATAGPAFVFPIPVQGSAAKWSKLVPLDIPGESQELYLTLYVDAGNPARQSLTAAGDTCPRHRAACSCEIKPPVFDFSSIPVLTSAFFHANSSLVGSGSLCVFRSQWDAYSDVRNANDDTEPGTAARLLFAFPDSRRLQAYPGRRLPGTP